MLIHHPAALRRESQRASPLKDFLVSVLLLILVSSVITVSSISGSITSLQNGFKPEQFKPEQG